MKFDMNRAWDDARAMLAGNSQMILVVAGVFFFLPYFALMLMSPDMSQNPAMQPGATDPNAMIEAMTALYADIWWMIILLAILQGVGTLALYALLRHSERPTVGEAISFGIKGLLPYIGAGLLQGAIIILALGVPLGIAVATGSGVLIGLVGLAAFIGAIYLYTKFSLTVVVIGLEKEFNPLQAIKRSWSLTKGNSLRIFLFYFLLFLAFMVISLVVGMIVGLILALAGPNIALFGNGLVSSLVNAAFVCVFLAVLAAVHQQLSGGSPDKIGETFE